MRNVLTKGATMNNAPSAKAPHGGLRTDSAAHARPYDLAAGLVMLTIWAIWMVRYCWGHWPPDLSALYLAAYFFAEGQPGEIYASAAQFFSEEPPAFWAQALTALGHEGARTFPYLYPPLWAALFAPVAQGSDMIAVSNLIYLWHALCLVLTPVLAYRIMQPPLRFSLFAALTAGLYATSAIVFEGIYQNQIQITVIALTLLAFERVLHGRPIAGGVALGLAAALKLSPIVLLVVLALHRQTRAIAACLAVLAGCVWLSIALAGWDLHRAYLEQLQHFRGQLLILSVNISIKPVLFQGWELLQGRPMPAVSDVMLVLDAPSWLDQTVTAIFALGLGAILWGTRQQHGRQALRNRLVAVSLWAALCGPVAWLHHYIGILMLVPGLVGLLAPALSIALLAAFAGYFGSAYYYDLYALFPAFDLSLPIAVAIMGALVWAFARAGTKPG
ncbi:MAG: glycosyltransferase family 87 protein [Pseudomonadota bacterium]